MPYTNMTYFNLARVSVIASFYSSRTQSVAVCLYTPNVAIYPYDISNVLSAQTGIDVIIGVW